MRINLAFSGGRTSAYMVEKALESQLRNSFCDDVEFIITFANTGREHEATLRFVHECDKRWKAQYGIGVVWLEAVVHEGRKPCSHVVVSFHSASRCGEPFEDVVGKYGLPNGNFLHCTRELKENPIISYMESLGETKGHIKSGIRIPATYETWIGIREDEPKRLTGNRNGKQRKVFPLADDAIYVGGVDVDNMQADKHDVLEFWSKMPFDLGIPEWWGNCIDCHKKSDKKLYQIYREDKSAFHFTSYLDGEYSDVKPQILEDGSAIKRKRFRGYRNTKELIASFKIGGKFEGDGGACETSCEPFMMDNEMEVIDE